LYPDVILIMHECYPDCRNVIIMPKGHPDCVQM